MSSVLAKRRYESMMAPSQPRVKAGVKWTTVLVLRIIADTKNGKAPTFLCAILSETATVKVPPPQNSTYENGDGDGSIITTFKNGDQVFVKCFATENVNNVFPGKVINVDLSGSMFNNKIFYKTGQVTNTSKCNVFEKDVYDTHVKGTQMGMVPSVKNLRMSDFPDESNLKYMCRYFVLPLSNDESLFHEISFASLDLDVPAENLVMTRKELPPVVGFNKSNGDTSNNEIDIVYRPLDATKTAFTLLLRSLPGRNVNEPVSPYNVFGMMDTGLWTKVCLRMVMCAKNWFVLGYTSAHNMYSIQMNSPYADHFDQEEYEKENKTEDGDVIYTTEALVIRMGIDLAATVKAAGVPVSLDYVKQFYASQVDVDVKETVGHPINTGYKMKLVRKISAVFNVSELGDSQDAFLANCKANVEAGILKFYAIFAHKDTRTIEEFSELIKQGDENTKPVMIYAVQEAKA